MVPLDVLTYPGGADGRQTCLERLRAATLAQLLAPCSVPLRSNAAGVLLVALQQQCAALGVQGDQVAHGLLLAPAEVDGMLRAMLVNWEVLDSEL